METSIITNQRLDRIDAQPVMARNMTSKALGVTLAFMVILLAMFTPRVAEAGPSDLDAAIRITFPTSAVANLCGNCHTDWVGLNPSYSSRIDYYIYNVLAPSPIPTTNTMYAMDSDQDGRTNLEEIQASTLAARPAQFPTGVSTGPNVANNWNWQIPDVDGDGCSSYFSRFTEAGVNAAIQTPSSYVAFASIVGTGNTYRRFNPRGWDIDDNDASQGCSADWTPNSIAIAPGTSTDNTKPGKVNTFSGAALASAAIPLKWVPVGDDGNGNGNGLPGDQTGGKAHSYEIRYTTAAFATGLAGRNPRSPADWEVMHNIAEPDGIASGGQWSSPSSPDSLMQALYEPRPDVPGTAIQTCNARNTTCTAGASYDIKARGTYLVVNAITNGTTYWVGMWTHDGVTRVTGNLSVPGTVTEQATLSNIIAVTAGGGGAAISSISPSTLSAPGTVTVSGYGLHVAGGNAAQMVLTNTAGTVVATAAITASPATAALGNLVGNFATLPVAGTYNLELRTTGGLMKTAWVQAITVSEDLPPMITSPLTATGQVGVPFSYKIAATNSPTSFNATPLPANLSFAGDTISGTPTDPVIINTTVSATNGGGTGSAPLVITINPAPPTAPTITACNSTTLPTAGQVGILYSFTCTATGGTAPYSWSAAGLPTGLSINSVTGEIFGTPSAAGTFGPTISVTGGGTSSAVTSILIIKGNQTVTLSCPASIPVNGTGACSATASSGLTAFFYAATGACTINSTSGAVTAAATSGSCSVTATQAGNATYNPAISAAFVIIIEGGPPPAITLFCPASIPVSGTGTCLATSSTGLTTFTYAAFGDCTVNSTIGVVTAATAVTTGSCSVTASQAGNATYPPATSAPSIIAITKLNQTVTVTCPSTLSVNGMGICSASSTSGLTTFTYAATGACTINSTTGAVTAAATAGTCSVTATQAGNATYYPATSAPSSIVIAYIDIIVAGIAGPNGTIDPPIQFVNRGETTTFTVSPSAGYTIASVNDDCGSPGSLSGMNYTTGPISMGCTVSATFTPIDITPPVITPNPLGSTTPFVGPLTVTLNSNEPNTTVFYTMNGGTPTTSSPSCAAPCTLTITRSTLLQYRGRDAAGNLSAPAYQVYKIAAVDLVMTHVSKTATTVKRGASFAITNAARNIGTLRSPPFKISFYLSTDRIITPADRKLSGYRTIPFGLAGQTSTPIAATTVTVPIATAPGVYYVGACAESDNVVSESNESNNCKIAGSSTITGSATIAVTY